MKQMKKTKPCITLYKNPGHLRTLEKCRKHEPQVSVFYIPLVFSNALRVLSGSVIHGLSFLLGLFLVPFGGKSGEFGQGIVPMARPDEPATPSNQKKGPVRYLTQIRSSEDDTY